MHFPGMPKPNFHLPFLKTIMKEGRKINTQWRVGIEAWLIQRPLLVISTWWLRLAPCISSCDIAVFPPVSCNVCPCSTPTGLSHVRIGHTTWLTPVAHGNYAQGQKTRGDATINQLGKQPIGSSAKGRMGVGKYWAGGERRAWKEEGWSVLLPIPPPCSRDNATICL